MKRRLTLAIGCLACTMTPLAAVASSQGTRTAQNAPAQTRPLTLLDAAQAAQQELDRRGLAAAHTIASVVFLKGHGSHPAHYDVRIEPPATLADGARLRGFSISAEGAIAPATDFRAVPGITLSTQPPGAS